MAIADLAEDLVNELEENALDDSLEAFPEYATEDDIDDVEEIDIGEI